MKSFTIEMQQYFYMNGLFTHTYYENTKSISNLLHNKLQLKYKSNYAILHQLSNIADRLALSSSSHHKWHSYSRRL